MLQDLSVKAQFSFEEVDHACKGAMGDLMPELPEDIRERLRCRRTPERHGTDTRVLIYQVWDKYQPTLLGKQYFSYSFGYDPVGRYFREPLAVQFYANRHRLYDKRDEVLSALWTEMKRAAATLHDFEATMTKGSLNLFRHFKASSREELQDQIHKGFLELIPYWHAHYAAVVDTYGMSLTREEVEAAIAGRKKFQPSGPRAVNSSPQFSRGIPASLRAEVLKRDGGRCLKCGARVDLHIDHILPVSLGGLTVLDNLQTLCSAENLGKGNRETTDYRKKHKD
jgi:hypothetical protein